MRAIACWSVVLSVALTLSCSPAPNETADPTNLEGEADGNLDPGAGTTGGEQANVGNDQVFEPVQGGQECGFDAEKVGKVVGAHVDNFGLKTFEGEPYWLHENCGTEKKVVWVVLSTGW